MSHVVIVADPGVAAVWADALCRDHHVVQTCGRLASFDDLFGQHPAEILIIDVENPDWSEVMLMPQAREAWPLCKVVVATADLAFRQSAIYQMGLWDPDKVLMKPVSIRLLVATIALASAELRSTEILHYAREDADTFGRHVPSESLPRPAEGTDRPCDRQGK